MMEVKVLYPRVLMTETVVQNNNFKFGDSHFQQTDEGTIVNKLGKNYASSYMGRWEKELLSRVKIKTRLILDSWTIFLEYLSEVKRRLEIVPN